MSQNHELRDDALKARANAYANESGFLVGAALRSESGTVYLGCNVENVAYPEGTCAEAGAIAAMCVAGDRVIEEIYVVAASPADNGIPCSPCGGCRQKIMEFARDPSVKVTMGTIEGDEVTMTIGELLPGAFTAGHMRSE